MFLLNSAWRIVPKSVWVSSSTECINAVKTQLNLWLNNRDSQWQTIREGLISFANQFEAEELQMIVNAQNIDLLQPSLKDLAAALWWDRGYYIFIFTGHSGSDRDGTIGWIEINDTERLTIEEFKDSFKQAIDQGLELAIFNS